MKNHKLLERQVKKYLPLEFLKDDKITDFLEAVNQSYFAFERDQELMNHAFLESEKEYNLINKNLKEEYDLKRESIANLYKSIVALEEESVDEDLRKEEDILFISKYLNQQIEKKKQIEKDLSTTVELLKTLLANLQSGILVEDENRKILFTNQLFCDMFGIPVAPDLMIGVDCTNSAEQSKDMFKNADVFSPRIDTILQEKTITTNELLETVDNRFLERDYIPIYIKNIYKGHLWKYNDVTQRIKTQNLLQQSEERNRLIMNSALNAIITIDVKGNINFWNNQAEIIFGWKKEEVVGKSLAEVIIPNEHKKGHEMGMRKFMETGEGPVLNKQLELPAIHKSGTTFPIEISIIPIQQNNEIIFCSFIQDISERKKAENNLKFQEEKYRNIIANMNLGLIEVDNEEIIKYANPSFSEISGYDLNELIGKNPSNLFISGENIGVIQSKIETRKQGISDIYQMPVKNKRGELRWWAISGAPNYDDKGNLVGSIGIHLDITSQKQLEIELENQKIKAEEASKAKETFLANMSHEIRTPLNAIIGFLRELSKQELTELQKRYIENSAIASKHLLAIINNVLDISKIEAGEMAIENENFILENSINNVVTILKPKAEQKNLQFKVDYDGNIARVLKGDILRIEQILFNLVGNSLKFTQKGEISVRCSLLFNDEQYQKITISISDTGIGMDKNYLDTIFKKFSQEDKNVTRKFGGTGLGMAITKELVELMHGKITVESTKDIGTTIHLQFLFPKGDEEMVEHKEESSRYEVIAGAKILLVEDNDLNRMVAQNTLQYYNCKVTEAVNGLEAIETLNRENFDVILMDIQMPEMDGIEATKIIREKLKLTTPIIALTANAFKSEIEKCYQAGINDYVTKPFEENILLEILAKQLEKMKEKVFVSTNEDPILYNLNALHNLSRGNKEFVLKMIQIFVTQVEEVVEKVSIAILNKDYDEVSRLVHKIKPSIEGVGVFSILDEVKLVEKLAKDNEEHALIQSLFDNIKRVLEKVIQQLKTFELKE